MFCGCRADDWLSSAVGSAAALALKSPQCNIRHYQLHGNWPMDASSLVTPDINCRCCRVASVKSSNRSGRLKSTANALTFRLQQKKDYRFHNRWLWNLWQCSAGVIQKSWANGKLSILHQNGLAQFSQKLPSSTTPLSFDAPVQRNSCEYLRAPYISRNYSHFISIHFCRW